VKENDLINIFFPKLKDIKEFPLDTLWAELQEQQLVFLKQTMGWNSLGLYCTCFI
jgi:hypothetical protein